MNRWRLGRRVSIHVYDGERPVATFLRAGDAAVAVAAQSAFAAGEGEGDVVAVLTTPIPGRSLAPLCDALEGAYGAGLTLSGLQREAGTLMIVRRGAEATS